MLSFLCIISLALATAVAAFSPTSKCAKERDRGNECTDGHKSPGIRWFFDNYTESCVAFKYQGCGGNNNRFKSIKDCEMRCIPQDYGWCALRNEAYKESNGQARICSGRAELPVKCPDNYICKNLAFFGVCCPKDPEELMRRNYRPNCTSGTIVKVDRGGFETPLLGRSCDDDFCPDGSRCTEQEIFSFCCQTAASGQ